MRYWIATFMWKKMSMKQSVHPQLNLYKRQIWLIYLIFTTVCSWLSLIPGSVFRLKKEDSEENSEDVSEGDREENIAGGQAWHGTKR